jgi:hypothetical protein
VTVHALAHARVAARRDEARDVILADEIVEVVVGLQDDAAAASAVAAARAALGDVSLAMERDTAFAAVPRLRVNFYFVNEHEIILPRLATHAVSNPLKSKNLLPSANGQSSFSYWKSRLKILHPLKHPKYQWCAT